MPPTTLIAEHVCKRDRSHSVLGAGDAAEEKEGGRYASRLRVAMAIIDKRS